MQEKRAHSETGAAPWCLSCESDQHRASIKAHMLHSYWVVLHEALTMKKVKIFRATLTMIIKNTWRTVLKSCTVFQSRSNSRYIGSQVAAPGATDGSIMYTAMPQIIVTAAATSRRVASSLAPRLLLIEPRREKEPSADMSPRGPFSLSSFGPRTAISNKTRPDAANMALLIPRAKVVEVT